MRVCLYVCIYVCFMSVYLYVLVCNGMPLLYVHAYTYAHPHTRLPISAPTSTQLSVKAIMNGAQAEWRESAVHIHTHTYIYVYKYIIYLCMCAEIFGVAHVCTSTILFAYNEINACECLH